MREIRYLTDDRDKEPRQELVLQHGGNGDLYISTVKEGEIPVEGVRLATSGGCAYNAPDLVMNLMTAFNKLHEEATNRPDWAKARGIKASG